MARRLPEVEDDAFGDPEPDVDAEAALQATYAREVAQDGPQDKLQEPAAFSGGVSEVGRDRQGSRGPWGSCRGSKSVKGDGVFAGLADCQMAL